MNVATKHWYNPKREVSSKQFSPDKLLSVTVCRLLVNFLTFPRELPNSLTFQVFQLSSHLVGSG